MTSELIQTLTGNPALLQVVALGVVLWWLRRQLLEWGDRYDRRTDIGERRTIAVEQAAGALVELAGRDSHTIRVEEGQRLPVEIYGQAVTTLDLLDPDASQH